MPQFGDVRLKPDQKLKICPKNKKTNFKIESISVHNKIVKKRKPKLKQLNSSKDSKNTTKQKYFYCVNRPGKITNFVTYFFQLIYLNADLNNSIESFVFTFLLVITGYPYSLE